MTYVVYLAHPVAPIEGGPTVAQNVENALVWLRAIVLAVPDFAVCAPWIPYVQALTDSGLPTCPIRARGMADDLAVLERCDAILLVGGRLSLGMGIELMHARKIGIPSIDWTEHRSPADSDVGQLRHLTAGFFKRRDPQHPSIQMEDLRGRIVAASM